MIFSKTLPYIIILSIFFSTVTDIFGCTSAIIGAEASASGRPLLWKHRDTSTIDNVVAYVAPQNGSFGYVGLFNADDRKLEQVWMGMNEAGFAVMNTASYNIKDDKVPAKKMDREGYLMTIALRSCRTVDDFEHLLNALPRPMGVEANFGVIDSTGAGAYFETNNHSFVKYDLKDTPDHILVRTNYSHSGRKNEGYGFVREDNANHLLDPFRGKGGVTPEYLTETVSRSFYHSMFGRDMLQDGDRWIIDQDFIPRYKSTATIVIEGCLPVADAEDVDAGFVREQYVMWTGLGYPPCSEIVPVWCSVSGVDKNLQGVGEKGHSPMCDRVKARRAEVFPITKGNGDKYIDSHCLSNDEQTGYIQVLVKQNLEVYDKIRRQRDNRNEESIAENSQPSDISAR